MLKIILIALAGLLVFFCWCACVLSSRCSRIEERMEELKMENSLKRYKELTREEKAKLEDFVIYRDIEDVVNEKDAVITDEEMEDLKEVVLNFYNEDSIVNFPLTHSCNVITEAYLNNDITMEELKNASYSELYNAVDGNDFSSLSNNYEMER